MNIKRIIREEVNDFDWVKDIDPITVINNQFSDMADSVNHDGWELTLEGNIVYAIRPNIVHKETNNPIKLRIVLGLDDNGRLSGKFPVEYKDNDGEWKPASTSPHTKQMVMSDNSVEWYMENKNLSLEDATSEVLNGFILLFYNNWYSLYVPLFYYHTV